MINERPNSKDRKYFILKRLLDEEHLSYHRLADDYFVSRSSIANDINWIKSLLAEDNVPLKFDNSGTFIEVDEVKKQGIIKRIISRLHNVELKSLFLDPKLYDQINETILKAQQSRSLKIPDIYLRNIILTIAVLVQRGKQGFYIEEPHPNLIADLKNIDNYALATGLLDAIEQKDIYKFKNKEKNYLSYIIAISQSDCKKQKVYSEDLKLEIKELIDKVAESLNAEYIASDEKLYEDLLFHITEMMMRLDTNTTIINPLLNDIKNKYGKIYGIVWYFLNELDNTNKFPISEDEVAFITIHFQAALERRNNIRKILFVCPHGIGTSSLASIQLQRILPSNAILQTTSLVGIVNKDLKDTDLIVSTIPLPQLTVPVVKISPLLTSDDLKNVMAKYIDITVNKNKSKSSDNEANTHISRLISSNILFVNEDITQNEIIDKLTTFNVWKDEAKRKEYLRTIKDREKLQSTYIGNGFAIPHGNPKCISNSCIAIAILKKPIKWGNNKVDIVCLLMMKDSDKNTLEPFMSLIMEGMDKKDSFLKKIMELSKYNGKSF